MTDAIFTLLPRTAQTPEALTGFMRDGQEFSIGDRVVLTAPNGDRVSGTLGTFYGVGRIAGMHVAVDHFKDESYPFFSEPAWKLAKEARS